MAADERSNVLDYAPAPPSRLQMISIRTSRFARATTWFLFRRSVSASEIAIAGAVVLSAVYVFWAARRFELGSDWLKPILTLTWTLTMVVAVATLRLGFRRQRG